MFGKIWDFKNAFLLHQKKRIVVKDHILYANYFECVVININYIEGPQKKPHCITVWFISYF